MSFKPYPKYKESGVEWLGRVPEHWTVMPIRLAARLESGHTPSRNHPEYWENCTIPWFTLADVWQIREGLTDVVTETKEKVSELGVANSAARVLPAGTVMLSRTASVGFSAIMGVDMATTQDFANWVCGPDVVPRFLLQAFRAMGSEFRRLMMGSTHNTIYMPDIASFRFVLPPPAEQSAVVSFIDHETAKIDALIAEQQRLIELLQEKRQAVISHAVTKGLNPDAPMKDSGIEWLGEVPEHWKIGRCRFYVDMLSGFAFPSQGFSEDEGDWRLLRGINVGVGAIRWEETVYWKREPNDGLDCYEMRHGDLVIGMDRPLISEGMRVARLSENDVPSLLLQRVVRLAPLPTIDAEYLQHLLGSEMFVAHFSPETTGVSVPHISPDQIAAFVIPVPPISEQKAIVSQIGKAIVKLANLVREAQLSVTLLQERRSALISAAVTGEIDVRSFAGGSEAA